MTDDSHIFTYQAILLQGMALRKNKIFPGGLFLKPDKQQTDALPIETLPAPPVVVIPLLQHAGGAPARPRVKEGDFVSMGQMIGSADEIGSAAVHASVSGTVAALSRDPSSENREAFVITIENNGEDEFASPIPYDKSWQDSTAEELIRKITVSGVIDFNGTAVPAHEKLRDAQAVSVETLVLNGMVTEPWSNADYRLLLEQTEKVLTGGLVCKKIIGARQLAIVINEKNAAVEQVLTTLFANEPFKSISIIKLKPKYPQHQEKLIVPAVEKNSLALGAATAAYIHDAVMECYTLFQRVVTVAGPAAESPKNLLVRIGTPVAELLKAGAVDLAKATKVVSGGPLSGKAVSTLDAPVIKSTNALLALDGTHRESGGFACINCGRCMSVCPMRLAPMRLAQLAQKNDNAESGAWHIDDCIECGCCAYVCPSAINLVHYLQYGKKQGTRSVHQKVLV